MTIRSRINFTLAISIILILFLGIFLFVNSKHIKTVKQTNRITYDIINNLFKLSNNISYYLANPQNKTTLISIDINQQDISDKIHQLHELENIPEQFSKHLSVLKTKENNLNKKIDYFQQSNTDGSQNNNFSQLYDEINSDLDDFINHSLSTAEEHLDYTSQKQDQMFITSLSILFLLGLIYLINAIIINKTIKYPLIHFDKTIDKISSGDMNAKVKIDDKNELGKLAKTFNRMISSINRQEKEKYEFISTISHQLRTPISSILWTAESITSAKNKDEIATITEKSQDLNSIVDHLLFYLEMTGKPLNNAEYTRTKIAETIQKILNENKKRIKDKKIKINLNNSLGGSEVLAHQKYLEKVLGYIINNAIVYNKSSGTINIDLKKTDRHIHLEISDTGYGIPAKDQNHIFSKFFRASNASLGKNEGSGISLYLAKLLIKQFGGTIELESHENKGTRVDITLPVAR